MVGKLKKYYFCHNSRLAAGQPEMDDIWPGVASSEILSCDNLGHRCLSLSIIILTEAEELWIMVSPFPIIHITHHNLGVITRARERAVTVYHVSPYV